MRANLITLAALASITALLHAQDTTADLIEPVTEVEIGTQNGAPAEPAPPPSLPESTQPQAAAPAGAPSAVDEAAPATAPAQQQEMQKSDEGYIIKDAGLNDILQFLAKAAGRQYFHNAKIAGPDYMVTGHLNDGNPLQQMEELAFMYGLSLHVKGNTIYALTQAQLAQLPSSEFHYQLRYLRPTDIEQIKELIKPMLSPGTGIVNFEPKTNTIVIIDSAHRIEQARGLLHNIDKLKGQIIVETKILRVNSGAAERLGVNWAASLGETGTSLNVYRSLNSMLGIDVTRVVKGSSAAAAAGVVFGAAEESDQGLVLSPLQLNGVLRALAEGGVARQLSNPTLITEDNELASISIIDRVPIITSTTTPSTTGLPTVSEEVRYKIDQADKTIDSDPDKHREIGISLTVTPTVLPDGTVRMRMRPRSAQISGEVISEETKNRYPRVTESMVESIARVPDGYSLMVGGFYGEIDKNDDNKVPLLGDLPVLNFFFKSKETVKERASLIFIVTPRSYDPSNTSAAQRANNRLNQITALDCDHDSVDPYNPGPAHEPNLTRTIRGMVPRQAPLYPEASDAFIPATPAGVPTKPRFARGSRR